MRHGETSANTQQIIAGVTDTPLNAEGIAQTTQVRAILARQWSVIATSNLQRTQQSAAHAIPHHPQLHLKGLAERNWGDLEGCAILDPMPYLETPNNGESWQEFTNRAIGAINYLLTHNEVPLIVAHSGIYRALCDEIQGTPYGARIANATPYLFTPIQETDWNISIYKGKPNES